MAVNYVWPLSNTSTPDELNTSFGPRIDRNHWDFHDGLDLPAPIGTPVHAVADGTVHHAGPGGTGGYRSRHVVLEVHDPVDGRLYVPYIHLDSIAEGVETGTDVTQGQALGTVGQDVATYPHLHIEFRKGSPREVYSVHPLKYLPYVDTATFTAPVAAGFSRLGGRMAARLRFGAASKREGDLLRVEVDLLHGETVLATRVVDFNDKSTINEGNDDALAFRNDIAVEGYQKSDMAAYGRTDLRYGILVRNLPADCDGVVAGVVGVRGNKIASAVIPVPDRTARDERVDFEDRTMPPAGWTIDSSPSCSSASVTGTAAAAYCGTRGVTCSALKNPQGSQPQRAALRYKLPTGRFQWTAEGFFNVHEVDVEGAQALSVIRFSKGPKLVAAAGLRRRGGGLRPTLVLGDASGGRKESIGSIQLSPGVWYKWTLRLLRLGTRETTAVFEMNEAEEQRVNWDTTGREPRRLRAGIALLSAGAGATVWVDDLRLTEVE